MVYIFYTRLPYQLPVEIFYRYLSLLPEAMIARIEQYRQWEDKLRSLLGKLLLAEALRKFLPGAGWLHTIQYNHYGRPYIDQQTGIDFNLSHTGDYVVCAIGRDIQVGIDIEKITPVCLNDFQQVMTGAQWTVIRQANNPMDLFFQYWVIKESVIKAAGEGLSIPLQDIEISNHVACCHDKIWFLRSFTIDPQYCACLATNKAVQVQFIFKHHLNFNNNITSLSNPWLNST